MFPSISTIYTIVLFLLASAVGNADKKTTASDLADRENVIPCSVRQFSCKNDKCIPILFFCDGDKDCEDGSDEDIIVCSNAKNLTCASSEFKCEANGNCIPNHWQCDGEKDCRDGSDEDEQVCQNKVCGPGEFTCRSTTGDCIPLLWVCDGNTDCSDGSDERTCNETCRSDEFTCANGDCIQKKWVCDSTDDCVDGSDEKDCPPIICDPATQFRCTENYCISLKWKCDGKRDCINGRDEINCTQGNGYSFCSSFEYQCSDKVTCLPKSWLCDGKRDCWDGGDESIEICPNVTCRADQFQCQDKTCISGHLHCSGYPDCADGSDERDCELTSTKCNPKTQFDCGGGSCIPLLQVCNGRRDCINWEDEPSDKCGINECSINKGGCSHKCVNMPIGFYCECNPGYKLVDNTTCRDINECEIPGSCSQICINEEGGFKCDCEKGYLRDPRNLTKCKAIEGHASLLLARRRDIRKISLDHHEMTSIVEDTNSATALDFVFRTGMIFWSDVTDKKIYKAPIDEGTDRVAVISEDITTCDGLAVDWIYDHLYWTDTGKNNIELSNLDGKMRKVLIQDGLEEPRAIALNPTEGWMFWTDWGSNAKIERAGMDGSHRQTIVGYDVRWPNGLSLDLMQKRIYWVDAKLNIISSCDYNGGNRRIILSSPEYLRHPFSITTFEDWVYWTDWDKAAVFKANKFTGMEVQAVTPSEIVQHPMVIHVYHPYRQSDGENHCQAVNGHCSHLCLPAPQINKHSPKISCACPDGLRMLPDGLTCVQDEIPTTTDHEKVTNRTTESDNYIPKIFNTTEEHTETPDDSGLVAGIVILISLLVLLLLAIAIYCIYRHYADRNITSMNFDNPVYRKTTEDQFSLEKGKFQPSRPYLSTVGEEAQHPLTSANSNDLPY
ncbi:hypothetical protein WA026_005757 [Henosepilachna vigintioctopunctata]|uniref:EGF-like domain-containing protein n=1 Tax=Henosepilachna vigintioctopunctata TaxID=420089 RepID=A0AAW1U453_9CUCU